MVSVLLLALPTIGVKAIRAWPVKAACINEKNMVHPDKRKHRTTAKEDATINDKGRS